MIAEFTRSCLTALVVCGLVACEKGPDTESEAGGPPVTAQSPVDVRSAVRQRFDTEGIETLLVYNAGRLRGTGHFIARAEAGKAPRLLPSSAVTVIFYREIGEDLSERAAQLGVVAGQAYLLLGPPEEWDLSEELLLTDQRFELLRDIDSSKSDEAIAESFGMKLDKPHPQVEKHGFYIKAGDDFRIPFFFKLR